MMSFSILPDFSKDENSEKVKKLLEKIRNFYSNLVIAEISMPLPGRKGALMGNLSNNTL